MEKKILVIDDDIAILEIIQIILEEKGFLVKTISDSTIVEDYLLHHTPEMILIDFWMSGLNGKKVVSQIKNNPKTAHIPIIMISANHDVQKIAQDIHADGFLAKPFDINDLVERVEKLTTRKTFS